MELEGVTIPAEVWLAPRIHNISRAELVIKEYALVNHDCNCP